jgi:hypothetical protein
MTNPHVAYGAARTAIDNFERTAALAVRQLQEASNAIAAVPGVTMPDDIKAGISAFRAAANIGLSAFLNDDGRTAMKAAA